MRVLCIDGNFYLHRIYHVFKHLQYADKIIPKNFLSLVCRDALAVKATHVIVAFDGGKVFRYDIYKEYKGHRGDHSDVYQHLKPAIKLLGVANLPCIQLPKYEADDVLCSLANKLNAGTVIIGTKDKDSYQYLKDNVMLWDSVSKPGKYFTQKEAEKKVGVITSNMVAFQALTGDAGDNVKRLLGPVKVARNLSKWGSFKAWRASDSEFNKFVKANKTAILLNKKLVTLKPDLMADFTLKAPVLSKDSSLPKSYFEWHEQLKITSKKSLFS